MTIDTELIEYIYQIIKDNAELKKDITELKLNLKKLSNDNIELQNNINNNENIIFNIVKYHSKFIKEQQDINYVSKYQLSKYKEFILEIIKIQDVNFKETSDIIKFILEIQKDISNIMNNNFSKCKKLIDQLYENQLDEKQLDENKYEDYKEQIYVSKNIFNIIQEFIEQIIGI